MDAVARELTMYAEYARVEVDVGPNRVRVPARSEDRSRADRERILWALDDARTDALAELRGVKCSRSTNGGTVRGLCSGTATALLTSPLRAIAVSQAVLVSGPSPRIGWDDLGGGLAVRRGIHSRRGASSGRVRQRLVQRLASRVRRSLRSMTRCSGHCWSRCGGCIGAPTRSLARRRGCMTTSALD